MIGLRTTGILLTLSLLALAWCGMSGGQMPMHNLMQNCADHLAHYLTLATSVPVHTLMVSVLVVVFLLSGIALVRSIEVQSALHRYAWDTGPNIFKATTPLARAFSDGILNTKRF